MTTAREQVDFVKFSAGESIPWDGLTACQQTALGTLDEMIVGNARVGILKGYAGTGKTYLSTLIVRHLLACNWCVKVMAPTGRAAKVLGTILKSQGADASPRTIHSTIYDIQPQDFSKGQMSLFANTGELHDDRPHFFVVDESSMVGNLKTERKEEGLHFGSGSLLHDILEFANLAGNPDNRILFVGDPGQLPPVQGNATSPALNPFDIDAALPEATEGIGVVQAELTSIVRQERGSLREFVTEVRNAMRESMPLPKDAREDVRPLLPEQLTECYLGLTEGGRSPERAMVLAHRNADVYDYNVAIREALFPGSRDVVMPGEVLLVRRNVRMNDHGELDISSTQEDLKNGTFVKVVGEVRPLAPRKVSIHGGKHQVVLQFAQCRIRFIHAPKAEPLEVVLLTNMLDKGYWMDYRRHYHLLEVGILTDFKNRMMDEHGWTPPNPGDGHYVEYSRKAKSDKLLNALRVSYGYSVTVHSAQGGEWDHVIVDPENPARDWHTERHQSDYKRWVYTSATRARKKLWFLKRSVTTVTDTEPELGWEGDED